MFDQKIVELDAEIAEHEKNNNAAYADQARKKKKAFESLKNKFASIAELGGE